MASNNTEDFCLDEDLSQWFVSQEASIGYNPEIFVVAKRNGFTFYMTTENGYREFKIKLAPSSVKLINKFMASIRKAIVSWM